MRSENSWLLDVTFRHGSKEGRRIRRNYSHGAGSGAMELQASTANVKLTKSSRCPEAEPSSWSLLPIEVTQVFVFKPTPPAANRFATSCTYDKSARRTWRKLGGNIMQPRSRRDGRASSLLPVNGGVESRPNGK